MLERIHAPLIRGEEWSPLPGRADSAKQCALVAVFIGSVLMASASWSQSCTPDFVITPTPNGPQHNRLKGVSAFDVNDVWAVGFTNGNNDQTLTEHWDGSSWTIVPSPNQDAFSALLAVGGIATNDLWAVGEDSLPNPLFVHWDGQSWTFVDPPPAAGPQFAVAALASNDVWSAGSGRSANNTALFNHWDGTSWTTVPNPPITPGSVTIRALTALAPNDIWAAGSLFFEFCDDTCFESETVRVLHWDGQNWSIASGPMADNWSRLLGIAAQSGASVWAVGFENGQALASHWDGTQWTNAPNIQLGAGSFFESVSVVGGDAWAVGWSAFPGRDQTLAVRYRCN